MSSATSAATPSAAPFSVFGYLPEYRQEHYDYAEAFRSGLTHLIFFSAEVDWATSRLIHAEDRLPPQTQWSTVRTLADAHRAKLLLCIGGGGRSEGFARLVRHRRRRAHFIADVARVVRARALDGIDFNWEYPQDMAEWRGFVTLLTELRQYMEHNVLHTATTTSTSTSTPPRLNLLRQEGFIVTIALHPHPRLGAVLQEVGLLPVVDFVHLMAYDHLTTSTGGGGVNESHSSLAYASEVLQPAYLDAFDDHTYRTQHASSSAASARTPSSTDADRDATDHRRKLTLGIPFYGRHYSNGLAPSSPTPAKPREPESYARLMFFVKQWARKTHPEWNETGAALRAMRSYGGYTYNSYDEVQAKMRLARSARLGNAARGIAGVMVWELGQDLQPASREPLALLNAISEQLRWWRREARQEAFAGDAQSEEGAHKKSEQAGEQDGSNSKGDASIDRTSDDL